MNVKTKAQLAWAVRQINERIANKAERRLAEDRERYRLQKLIREQNRRHVELVLDIPADFFSDESSREYVGRQMQHLVDEAYKKGREDERAAFQPTENL